MAAWRSNVADERLLIGLSWSKLHNSDFIYWVCVSDVIEIYVSPLTFHETIETTFCSSQLRLKLLTNLPSLLRHFQSNSTPSLPFACAPRTVTGTPAITPCHNIRLAYWK